MVTDIYYSSDFILFLIPAIKSYNSLNAENAFSDQKILSHWSSVFPFYLFFALLETIYLFRIVPFYYEIKICICIWYSFFGVFLWF